MDNILIETFNILCYIHYSQKKLYYQKKRRRLMGGLGKIFVKGKVPLTDRMGKTIYVRADEVDKYVLTAMGWLQKDKEYKVSRLVGTKPIEMKKTGWEIHLGELREAEFNKRENTPEKIKAREKILAEHQDELNAWGKKILAGEIR